MVKVAGDIYQVNLAQRLALPSPCTGWDLYQQLAAFSPAPFSGYYHGGDFEIASSSPERFLRLSGTPIQTRPIKGTRPRAPDPTRDAQQNTIAVNASGVAVAAWDQYYYSSGGGSTIGVNVEYGGRWGTPVTVSDPAKFSYRPKAAVGGDGTIIVVWTSEHASGRTFEAAIRSPLDAGDRLDLPIFTGVDRQYLLDRPDEGRAWLRQVLLLTEALRGRSLFNLDDVSEIRIDRETGLVVHTRDHGVPVVFGRDDFGRKLDQLERIYGELEPRLTALYYIDLNVPDRVVVKVDPKYAAGRNEKQRGKGLS